MKLSQQMDEFDKRGEHRVELSAAARELVGRVGVDGVAALRFSPPSANAPTNDEKLARMVDAEKFKELLRGSDQIVQGGIYKADELDKKTLAAVYRSIMFPPIYLWRLPALSDAKIRNFADHAALWVERYLPNGLAIMDHIALIGVMLDGLWDCFARAGKGEAPQWHRKPKKVKDEAGSGGESTRNVVTDAPSA